MEAPKRPGRPRIANPKRPRQPWIMDIGTRISAQRGKCAVPRCFAHVPHVGRARALDVATGKVLCKSCSMILGLVGRERKRLQGLIEYLERNDDETK